VVKRIRATSLLFLVALGICSATQLVACGGDDSSTEDRIARERQEAAKLARQEERIRQLEREARQARKESGAGSGQTPAPSSPNPSTGALSRDCGNGVSANSVTSCGFAQAVREAFYSGGQRSNVTAHSDATGLSYEMSCTAGSPHVCTGGRGAEVRFP